jgi:hypothetical protein
MPPRVFRLVLGSSGKLRRKVHRTPPFPRLTRSRRPNPGAKGMLQRGPRLTRSSRKRVAEHREAANGFRLGRLVLKNIPVLGELAVFETHDVGGDP